MNQKQQEFLAKWRKENEFEGSNESEWTPATCIHSSDIEYLYQQLKALE
jgi:hypothetical protein